MPVSCHKLFILQLGRRELVHGLRVKAQAALTRLDHGLLQGNDFLLFFPQLLAEVSHVLLVNRCFTCLLGFCVSFILVSPGRIIVQVGV